MGRSFSADAGLSIIDLAGGAQPMPNEDGSAWVTSTAKFTISATQCPSEARGHRFATRSDTEMILHSYEEYGPDCVSPSEACSRSPSGTPGTRTRLFLARDRVGKKPLFYTIADGQFLFASELQSLLVRSGGVTHPDMRA